MEDRMFVMVSFVDDRLGRQRLAYAREVADAAKASLITVVPVDDAELRYAKAEKLVTASKCPAVVATPADIAGIMANCQTQGYLLAVTSGKEPYFNAALTLNPADESVISRSGKREALVPFGVGAAAQRALQSMAPWLQRLEMSVCFYHTTWQDQDVPSDAPPRSHMCEEARSTEAALIGLANGYDLTYESAVETADAVEKGIYLTALCRGSSLIAMARGHDVIKGSYVDEVAARSSVPLVIAPDSSAQEVSS